MKIGGIIFDRCILSIRRASGESRCRSDIPHALARARHFRTLPALVHRAQLGTPLYLGLAARGLSARTCHDPVVVVMSVIWCRPATPRELQVWRDLDARADHRRGALPRASQ